MHNTDSGSRGDYSNDLYGLKAEEVPSSMRRLTDSSIVYLQRGTDVYPAFDLATKLFADVLYARWEGLESVYHGGKPDITTRKLKNFSKRMGLPDTEDGGLIDTKRSCFEDTEIRVYVRSITEIEKELEGEPLSDRQYYKVGILNACRNDDPPERKVDMINNVTFDCQCDRFTEQKLCRAPIDQRKLRNDHRDRTSIPAPYVVPADLHVSIAMNYATTRLNAYNLEIFGYPEHVVQAEKELIVKMRDLRIDKRWPRYRINWAFMDFGKRVFDPLLRLERAPTLEYQLKILRGEL